jgi:predicted dehydrogenase
MIGLGSIGQRHLRNIRQILGDSCDIIAYRVRGLKQTLSDKLTVREGVDLEEEYKIKSFYDIEEALAQKPDVAIIANPTSEHMKYALLCAKAGCHLFIDKPISDNLDFTEELQTIAREKNLIVFVGYQNRYNPALLKLKEWVDEKKIGDIVYAHAEIGERVTNFHKYEDYRIMCAVRKDLGGGVVLSQIHEIDYLYWIFGMPADVYAVGGKLSDLEIDVEDVANILFRVQSNSGYFPVNLHMDYLQYPPSRVCKVVGTKGKIQMDILKPSIRCDFNDGTYQEELYETFTRNDMFIDEMKDFFSCVKENKKPSITFDDGINSLKIALAVKESMENRKIIDI